MRPFYIVNDIKQTLEGFGINSLISDYLVVARVNWNQLCQSFNSVFKVEHLAESFHLGEEVRSGLTVLESVWCVQVVVRCALQWGFQR